MSHVKLIDESLSSSDYSVLLELSDMIKSKQASSSSVLSEINNKVNSSNVECACTLLDCLIKNSGPTFINELVNFNSIFTFIAEYIQSNTNSSVKQPFVEWAHLLKDFNPFIFDLYIRLKYNNIEFNKYTANQVILECSLAPEWQDSNECQIDGSTFNLINRKHHCRNCGKCVCNNCSKDRMMLPKYGIMQLVRVCSICFSNSNNSDVPTKSLDLSEAREQNELELAIKESLKLQNSSTKSNSNLIDQQEEEMIQKAIQLSLKDNRLSKQSSNIRKNVYEQFESQNNNQVQMLSNEMSSPSPISSNSMSNSNSIGLDLTASEIASLDLFYAW
eukprot:NODE_953_length_2810_cov_0.269273.p1 type:complete len:332 gc:universal NODE_953_length_2810_cov_0.269273:457-1452(+)